MPTGARALIRSRNAVREDVWRRLANATHGLEPDFAGSAGAIAKVAGVAILNPSAFIAVCHSQALGPLQKASRDHIACHSCWRIVRNEALQILYRDSVWLIPTTAHHTCSPETDCEVIQGHSRITERGSTPSQLSASNPTLLEQSYRIRPPPHQALPPPRPPALDCHPAREAEFWPMRPAQSCRPKNDRFRRNA